MTSGSILDVLSGGLELVRASEQEGLQERVDEQYLSTHETGLVKVHPRSGAVDYKI